MGATQNIKTLIFSSDLTDRTCKNCNNFFSLNDYKNDNWDLEYRTNYNMDFDNFKTGTSKGKVGVVIELYHRDCPQVEERHPTRKDYTIAEYK